MSKYQPPCSVKPSKKNQNAFGVKFDHLTRGELMALRNALINYSTSPVAADVLAYLNNALTDANIDFSLD